MHVVAPQRLEQGCRFNCGTRTTTTQDMFTHTRTFRWYIFLWYATVASSECGRSLDRHHIVLLEPNSFLVNIPFGCLNPSRKCYSPPSRQFFPSPKLSPRDPMFKLDFRRIGLTSQAGKQLYLGRLWSYDRSCKIKLCVCVDAISYHFLGFITGGPRWCRVDTLTVSILMKLDRIRDFDLFRFIEFHFSLNTRMYVIVTCIVTWLR